jgi:hypothetical protein
MVLMKSYKAKGTIPLTAADYFYKELLEAQQEIKDLQDEIYNLLYPQPEPKVKRGRGRPRKVVTNEQ